MERGSRAATSVGTHSTRGILSPAHRAASTIRALSSHTRGANAVDFSKLLTLWEWPN